MGYETKVEGRLNIVGREITAADLAAIKDLFAETHDYDNEYLKKYDTSKGDVSYIQFTFTNDFTGIQWDRNEKFYDIPNAVNFIVQNMPDGLELEGSLSCQGEEDDDRYLIVIGKDGFAEKQAVAVPGTPVSCPHCGKNFRVGV